MYDLLENPTALDIIQRSVTCHPSMFRDMLIKQAEQHDDHAQLTQNARAKQGAIAQRSACLKVYDFIGALSDEPRYCAEQIGAETGTLVIALNVAAKLQCLPMHVRTASLAYLDN